MKKNLKQFLNFFAILVIALPVLGILMGGIYSWPAMRLTKCRDPLYTILLGVGLSITVIGIGALSHLSFFKIAGTWFFAIALLTIRRRFGKLDHNLERFGFIHAFVLIGMICLVTIMGRSHT